MTTGKWANKLGCTQPCTPFPPSPRPKLLWHCPYEGNETKWVVQEALGRLWEDLHRFRQRCETYKAVAGHLPRMTTC